MKDSKRWFWTLALRVKMRNKLGCAYTVSGYFFVGEVLAECNFSIATTKAHSPLFLILIFLSIPINLHAFKFLIMPLLTN